MTFSGPIDPGLDPLAVARRAGHRPGHPASVGEAEGDLELGLYTVLYCTILYYTILYYTILYYTILYYTILYYTILYYTILYYTILYYTILYYTILYYTILYYDILPLATKTIFFCTFLLQSPI